MAEENVLLLEDNTPYYCWNRPMFRLREYRTGRITLRNNASVVCYVDDDLRPVGRSSRLLMGVIHFNPRFYHGQRCAEIYLGDGRYMYLLVIANKRDRRRQNVETLQSCLELLRDMCANQAVEELDIPVDIPMAISYYEFKETIRRLFKKTDVTVSLYAS